MIDLNDLAREARQTSKDKGWDSPTREDWNGGDVIPRCIVLMHAELSEALEAYRQDDLPNYLEELSDVVIRLLDTVGAMEIDFEAEILRKMAYNKTRPRRHGGKKC